MVVVEHLVVLHLILMDLVVQVQEDIEKLKVLLLQVIQQVH